MASPTAEGRCNLCEEIKSKRRKTDSQPHSFSYHVDLAIFEKTKNKQRGLYQQRKAEKKKTIQDLEKIVSALRNTLGGSIVVHLLGHQPNDRYLGHFDDFVGNRFRELIQNGELYVDTYTRKWIDQDFLLITVTKTEGVSTVDFSTKVNTDFENTNPTLCNIRCILNRPRSTEIIPPAIRGIDQSLQNIHESRCIQLKCYKPSETQVKVEEEDYISQVVNFIWDDLKFKHNLTSMSKVEDGGSFYVGIEEKDNGETPYHCKVPDVQGFDLKHHEREAFTAGFLKKFEENVTVLDLDAPGFFRDDVGSLNLIKLQFQDYKGVCVLEIAIRYSDGVVFYDKKGPRAYKIEDEVIRRMDRLEWLRKVRSSVH